MPLDDVVLVYDLAGSLEHRNLHGPMVDQILASEDEFDDILWGLANHHGTVEDLVEYEAATDTTTVANHRTFDAFGNVVAETAPAVTFAYAFTGRRWDADVELQYNRRRWCDPNVGRWVSEDPLGFGAGDANLARYVGNSTVNAADPSGLEDYPLGGYHHPPFANTPGAYQGRRTKSSAQPVENKRISAFRDVV